MLKYLKELCELPGASGWEDAVADFICEKAAPYAQITRDRAMGNVYVFKKGAKPRAEKLMVCAHMDEVGMIIRDIDEKGYLKFSFVGGVDRRVCIGKYVLVGDAAIPGVVGVKAVHLTTKDERKKVPKCDELYIDIGCSSREQAEKIVSLGDRAVFDSKFISLGNLVKAKAIDDRVGCAILLELIEQDLEYDTWFAFTVQEEVGLRGAACAANAVKPDRALVVEGTTAADLPDAEGSERVCCVDRGAVIGMMDRGTIYDRSMSDVLRSIANENGIPWQTKTVIAGATDAGAIHKSRAGIPTASVSVPVRYIHSPSCVTSPEAIAAAYNLTREFINSGK